MLSAYAKHICFLRVYTQKKGENIMPQNVQNLLHSLDENNISIDEFYERAREIELDHYEDDYSGHDYY